jgi:hypothetical protein
MRALLVALLLVLNGVLVSGCLVDEDRADPVKTGETLPALPPLVPVEVDTKAGQLHAELAAGALSSFTLANGGKIDFPPNVFLFQDKKFSAAKTVDAKPGAPVQLLLPPGMTQLTLTVAGGRVVLDVQKTGNTLVQGENVLDWFKVQREQYPNRCAGCPNYAKAQQYFAGLFRSFGYQTVEVDPYGTNALRSQLANVVAYRYPKTDATHPQWLGVGGHYDVVTATREGALDDTSGTLMSLEIARVFANVSTNHNLVVGLWGGEESGLMGSAFFTKTNPNVVAQMRAYVNLDASAFSWPAPRGVSIGGSTDVDCSQLPARATNKRDAPFSCPDPVLVTAGPDGAAADLLLTLAKKIQREIMVEYPDPYFLYEYVGQGQAQGYAKINAQSDHTSFIAAGVPSYMLINGDLTVTPVGFHNRADTIENWTRYAYQNWYVDAEFDDDYTAAQWAEAERLVVDSIETYLWLTFYAWLHFDLGIAGIPQPAPPLLVG